MTDQHEDASGAVPAQLPSSATKWQGSVTLDDETFAISADLLAQGDNVTGVLYVFDSIRQKLVFLGDLSGSRTGSSIELATQEGIQLSGFLAAGQVTGNLTFPPVGDEPSLDATMTLTVSEGDFYQLFVPAVLK